MGRTVEVSRAARYEARSVARAIIKDHSTRHGVMAGRHWRDLALRFTVALEDVYDDYLRRHHDAVERYVEIVALRQRIEELERKVET